jgi:hypothetical protein
LFSILPQEEDQFVANLQLLSQLVAGAHCSLQLLAAATVCHLLSLPGCCLQPSLFGLLLLNFCHALLLVAAASMMHQPAVICGCGAVLCGR